MKSRFVRTVFEGLVRGHSLALHLASETGIRRNGGRNWVRSVRISAAMVGGCWTAGNVGLLLLPYDGLQEAQGGDASRGR